MSPKHLVVKSPVFTRALVFRVLRYNDFLLRFLDQLGSILGPNLGLCWALFHVFLLLEIVSYLEVVLASIFHRFLVPLAEQKSWFRIVNSSILYTSAFFT